MKKCLLYALTAFCSAGSAQAAITPFLQTVTDIGGGQFRWDYCIHISNDAEMSKDTKFVIYDFAGYVPGTVVASYNALGFVASSELTTTQDLHAGGVLQNPFYPDDPTISNLVFTWTGADYGQTYYPTSPGLDVDFFTAVSTFSGGIIGAYSARDTNNRGLFQLDEFNTGFVGVPYALPCAADAPCDHGGGQPPAVPEPETWALAILGFVGVGAELRRARRRQVTFAV